MKIAISGSSGFIGKHLNAFFTTRGETVVPLKRSYFRDSSDEALLDALSGCDVVINLAGSTINQRWTEAAKRSILNSRVNTTHRLVSVINAMPVKPGLFISASAVGIYPQDGIYNESSSSQGKGFLADVCRQWEEEAQRLSTDVRLCITRFGVVLASDGGALPLMLLPFRFFLGGKTASGNQGFSWIHIEDVMSAMLFIITHKELCGIINLVSPQPATNRIFAEAASLALKRPAWFTIPKFVFHLLYGEGESIITEGQQVYPARLLSAGYSFHYPDIRVALQSLVV